MDTEVLGFIFTEKCNFRCSHCCNESGPGPGTTMLLDEIKQHVGAAARLGRFAEIGISGGEPFLFPAELLSIVETATSNGLTSSVTSNGFWGRTDERARAVLTPLVDAGLAALSLSVSQFHLPFTTEVKLRNAASASVALGVETRVNVVETSGFGTDDARRIFQGLDLPLTYVSMPLIPAGRADRDVAADQLLRHDRVITGNCRPFFSKVAVTAQGDVYPCCSPGGFTPPLLGGNLSASSLEQIIESMESSLLIQVLEGAGPQFFAHFIDEALDRHLLTEGFVDQCHLCHTIMTDERMWAVAQAALLRLQSELTELHLTLSEIDGLTSGGTDVSTAHVAHHLSGPSPGGD